MHHADVNNLSSVQQVACQFKCCCCCGFANSKSYQGLPNNIQTSSRKHYQDKYVTHRQHLLPCTALVTRQATIQPYKLWDDFTPPALCHNYAINARWRRLPVSGTVGPCKRNCHTVNYGPWPTRPPKAKCYPSHPHSHRNNLWRPLPCPILQPKEKPANTRAANPQKCP